MKEHLLKHIRFRLLAPFFAGMAILLFISLLSLNYYQSLEQTKMETRSKKQLSNNFDQEIKNGIEQLDGLLHFISQKESLKKPWLSQQRKRLLAESSPIFIDLRYKHHITHFYFHNLDGTNYLRVHSPNQYGDNIGRKTLKQAIVTGDMAAGLEFGTLGQFVLRVVIPWKIDNEIVGYLELGKNIDHILDRLSKNNGYQLVLTINKKFIVQHKLEQTEFFKINNALLDDIKYILIIHQTVDQMPAVLLTLIDFDNIDSSQTYHDNGRDYLVSQVAIKNSQQQKIASLFYLVDKSTLAYNHQELNQKLVGLAISITLFILLLYFFYSRRLEPSLRHSYENLNNEIAQRKEAQTALSINQVELKDLVQQRSLSLKESNQRYQTLFDKTADALLIIEGHQFVDCNQAALDMLGFANKKELYDSHPSALSPETQPDGELSSSKADLMIETAFNNGSHRFEWDHKRKNGEVFPVEVLLTAIPFDNSPLLHVVWRDISERKEAAAEIEYQAYYDALTGLPNRKLLLDRLNQTYITSRRHHFYSALFFIDLDRFKSINDSLGHTFGDKLLIESARRIESVVWDEDTVSRFGGDEYVILIKNLGQDKAHASLIAKKIATRIQTAFLPAFLIENQELHITTSIGITLFPLHDESIEDIIKHADTAMYSAKESGRNQTAFYLSSMHEKVIKRLSLEKDLRAAIKENQLEIYYQPQLDSVGNFVAVEALIRWHHKTEGYINPEEFISIAEDSGLIYDIGDFVLSKAIQDILAVNKEHNLELNLSVNISPYQFIKEEFVGKIKTVIVNHQLPSNFLTLEVTEGVAIDNLNETIEKLENLRHLGVRISLDDFGTGYSSLSHLKRLPINELKIDKSFVFDVLDDPQDALLVQSIINIAHKFGLTVVAEGVETKEQLEFLKQHNCNIIQGYYYSRPLPLDKLHQYVKTNCIATK